MDLPADPFTDADAALPPFEFFVSATRDAIVGVLSTFPEWFHPSVLAVLEGSSDVPPAQAVAVAAATPAGPYIVGELASRLSGTSLCEALCALTHAPLRTRRVLARLRSVAGGTPPGLLLDALLALEQLLAAADPGRGLSLWLPRSLAVTLDSIVVVSERAGVLPTSASATLPVLLAGDALAVRSLLDLEGNEPPVFQTAGLPFDAVLLRSTLHGMLLLGAFGCAVRLLYLLELSDPDPTGTERRLLRRLLLTGKALVPPERVPHVWRATLD